MTTGLSGTYAISATDLTLQPTVGRWGEREVLGVDGNAHAIYPSVRTFELSWVLMSVSDFQQVNAFFSTIAATGSVTADLPQWGASDFRFQRYSGVVLREPSFDNYFNGYPESAKLLLVNIVT